MDDGQRAQADARQLARRAKILHDRRKRLVYVVDLIADTCGSANPARHDDCRGPAVVQQMALFHAVDQRDLPRLGIADRGGTHNHQPAVTDDVPSHQSGKLRKRTLHQAHSSPRLLASYPERGDKRSRKKQECTRNPGTWARATEFAGFRGGPGRDSANRVTAERNEESRRTGLRELDFRCLE